MFVSLTNRRMFTSKNKNSGTKLSFFFIVNARYACKTIMTSKRCSTVFQTDVLAHREFLNETIRNGELKNFMYAIIEV